MKYKAICTALLAATLLAGCTGTVDEITLDRSKVNTEHTLTYHVTSGVEGMYEYDNTYTFKADEKELVISSKAELPYIVTNTQSGEKEEKGVQTIEAISRIAYDDGENYTFGMPLYVEQSFVNTGDKTQYVAFTFEHDHSIKSGILKTRKYSVKEDAGFKETLYTVPLTKQYFDKDSLPFIASAFPENGGVISISSGNRDKLQTVRFEFFENEQISTDAGTFECKSMRIRPNTDFSVNQAMIYFDAVSGIPIKVVQDSSVMILTSID